MKVINLSQKNHVYSCNTYLVLGDWNTLDDVNTIIDPGRDAAVLDILLQASTGVGKRRVEQILVTHSHYDHVSLIPTLKSLYNPAVWAGTAFSPDVDWLLGDGQVLRVGDLEFEALYTPGHSNDSYCFYCPHEHAIFSGDTTLLVQSCDGTYEKGYVDALRKISQLDVQTIYPGHGPVFHENCHSMINNSLKNVLNSRII